MRHESLRTALVLVGGGPEQRIQASVALPWTENDLTTEADPVARAAALVREEATRPFELDLAPLWRARLLTLAPERHVLVLTMHHAISDGASMGVLFDDLSAFYALETGLTDREPEELAFQFGDYAADERAQRDASRDEEHLAFWRRMLSGELPTYTWPGGRGRASRRGGQVALELTHASLARLESHARAHGLTTQQLALAAWFVLLGAASGLDDLRSGFAASLRQRRGFERQIGFFVQSLVLRTTTRPDQSFLELARALGTRTLEALAHEALPWDHVVRTLETHGGPSLAPVFFSHMRDTIRAPRLGAVRARWSFVDPLVARFELALVLHEGPDGLHGFLEYDESSIAPASARLLAADFGVVLQRAVAVPDTTVAELAALVRARPRERRAPLPFPIRTRKAQ
jgi:hypothetical protein